MSFGHLIVVLLIVLILFGPGRLSVLMSEVGKGLKSLRQGLDEGVENKKPEQETNSQQETKQVENKRDNKLENEQ